MACGYRPLCTGGLIGNGYSTMVPAGTTLEPVPAGVLARIKRFGETTEAD